MSLGQVAEQNASYRKGLVLGLTMAEVGLLIIFVLLLLIAFEEVRRDEALNQFVDKEAVDKERLAKLHESEALLQELANDIGSAGEPVADDFRQLVRLVKEVAKSKDGAQALKEGKEVLDEMREASRQIQEIATTAKQGDGAEIAKAIKAQSHRIANQEGQLKRYETMLEASGQGKGERPCWVKPDGKIDYLYEVVLGSDGIRMRELIYPERTEERKLLPMPEVDPNEALTEALFLAGTRPLFESSLAANCRFFVVVYDGTAVHEKPLYKSQLRTVEGHFYKRLSNAAPPF